MSLGPLCLAKVFKEIKKKRCYTGVISAGEVMKMVLPGALALQAEAEGAGLVQSGERMASEGPHCSP